MRRWGLLTLLLSGPAWAHSGLPAVAYMLTPKGVGLVTSSTIGLTWMDANTPTPTGTATVALHYTSEIPRTFSPYVIPQTLTGTVIATLLETGPDAHVWDVSNVPTGNYFVWSRVDEPPQMPPSAQIISFAPAIVSVVQPGESPGPAVLITDPDSDFRYADQSFTVRYSALDPDGTGTVRLEAVNSTTAMDFEVIADNLPAVRDGSFVWDTSRLAEGDWTLRATISDARGRTFTSYGLHFLFLAHFPPSADAGPNDARVDAGVTPTDAGFAADASVKAPAEKSCSCNDLALGWAAPTLWLFGVKRPRRAAQKAA